MRKSKLINSAFVTNKEAHLGRGYLPLSRRITKLPALTMNDLNVLGFGNDPENANEFGFGTSAKSGTHES